MAIFSLVLVLVLPLVPIHALQLHHRLLHPSSPPDTPFLKTAVIRLHPGIDSVPTLQTDLEPFTGFETQHVTGALYQLALDQGDSPWLISSVKAVSLSSLPLDARFPHFLFPSAISSTPPMNTSFSISLTLAAPHLPSIIS